MAFVTVTPDSALSAEELHAWVAEHVPERAAAPKHVEIVDVIPLTSVGKQYKPELRRRAAEQAARAALAGTVAADQVAAVLVNGSARDPRPGLVRRRRGSRRPVALRVDMEADPLNMNHPRRNQ